MTTDVSVRGVVLEDVILVSDVIHGSKPSLGITRFRNISASLTQQPVSGQSAESHERGDYWTNGTIYMVVVGTVNKLWAHPVNDSIQGGGGGGISPQQLQALRSAHPYGLTHAYHDSTSAARPTISNIVVRADGLATFDLSGGWTHTPGDDTRYQVTILIRASGQGDTGASAVVGIPEVLMGGPAGAQGPQGPKGDTGDTGPAGARGQQGLRGEQGPPGADGGQGAQGPAGRDGATGPQGDQGVQGIQGVKGDKGDTGDTGPAGPQGEPGTSATGVVTDVSIRGQGSNTQLVVLDGGASNALPILAVPSGGTAGQVLTWRGVQDNLWGWTTPATGGGTANVAPWAQVGNTDDVPDTKISNNFARRTEIEGEIGLLEQAIEAGSVSQQLRLFDHDLTIIQHPEGIWEPADGASIATSAPAAFLFENSTVETNRVPAEPNTAPGYNFTSDARGNFVRIHSDPNSDDNAFPGVSPYASGLNDIVTPANQKKKLITGLFSQGFASRGGNDTNDDTTTFLGFGDKRLIRFNQRGIDVSIGSQSATNRDVTHFVGLTTITLPI